MRNIVIVGAGGLGKEVLWAIEDINNHGSTPAWNVLGFVDDSKEGNIIGRYNVISTINQFNLNDIDVVIAIADSDIRYSVFNKIQRKRVHFPNIISPSCKVSKYAKIGIGNIFLMNSIISVDVEVGDFNIVDFKSYVGHDAKLENFVTLFPSCNISGFVSLNNQSMIGVGCSILQNVNIGKRAFIGANSLVTRNIKDNMIAFGAPCNEIEKR